jgi:hypothetical protein
LVKKLKDKNKKISVKILKRLENEKNRFWGKSDRK